MGALLALARAVLAGLTSKAGLVTTAGAAAFDVGPFGNGEFGGGDGSKPRRRRRRALTASDKADIAFISGTLGKAAGKDFAMIVAART